MIFDIKKTVSQDEVLLQVDFTDIRGYGNLHSKCSVIVTPRRIITNMVSVKENNDCSTSSWTIAISSVSSIFLTKHRTTSEQYLCLSWGSKGEHHWSEIVAAKLTKNNIESAEAIYSCVSKLLESL